jgi:predicted site-specific integrase-resolvase
VVSELLTLREACKRFGLYPEKIYGWAKAGALHPVQPAGRLLYPEWELRELVSSDGVTPPYLSRFDLRREVA